MVNFIRIALLALCGISTSSYAVTIDYQNFDDLSAFTLNGVTDAINTGGQGVIGPNPGDGRVLRLTNTVGQSGSAFLTNSISLANSSSFSTFFEFQFTDQENTGADGIVFVVQTNAANVGGGGGGIGYSGIGNSVGVEFDNWDNGAGDGFNGNHAGIDINGSLTSVVRNDTLPAQLDSGSIFYSWVDYDGVNDTLEVRLALTDTRPAAALLSAIGLDLPTILGQTDAFVGFTSGTGYAGADHDIRRWVFNDDFDPIDPNAVPEPTTIVLMGLGLLGFGFRRKLLQTK